MLEPFSLLPVALGAETQVALDDGQAMETLVALDGEAAELLPAERDLAADLASAGSWKDIADREELKQLQSYCPPRLAKGQLPWYTERNCTCAEHVGK